jgi:hypothetical protein
MIRRKSGLGNSGWGCCPVKRGDLPRPLPDLNLETDLQEIVPGRYRLVIGRARCLSYVVDACLVIEGIDPIISHVLPGGAYWNPRYGHIITIR